MVAKRPGDYNAASLESRYDSTCQAEQNLLVVEPEPLLRWSLATYLKRWFHVFPVDSTRAADQILDDRAIDAVIVSEDLTDHGADEVEAHARARNARARVVRTLTRPPDHEPPKRGTVCLEKPFELSALAILLGISSSVPPQGERRR